MPTMPITNDNIKDYVAGYIINQPHWLPKDLQGKEIGKWDVSNVTDMFGLFSNFKYFNQPLDKWDVSNVTDMREMFKGCFQFNQPLDKWTVSEVLNMRKMFSDCRSFNQPLNDWNVSEVRDMFRMFYECTKFNQPLDRWDVSEVRDMGKMFSDCTSFNQPLSGWNTRSVTSEMFHRNVFDNCGISEENKPIFRVVREIEVVEVDPNQIHKESKKINYAKLNSFLKKKSGSVDVPANLVFPTYINTSLTNIINESGETEEKKAEYRQGLKRIMDQRLNGVEYSELSPKVRASIYYSLKYLEKQPDDFKKIYVDTFIQECVRAYDGPDGMTCAGGAFERIVSSFVKPCISSASEGKENEEYEKLVAIIVANPEKLIQEYIQDWYKLHNNEGEHPFPDTATEMVKKADLKSYLMAKFPRYEGLAELVDAKIAEIADIIGYDDEVFTYGGKRRKTKKNRKLRKTNKKLRKTKTNRKTNRNKK